jgi:hypothetical protein
MRQCASETELEDNDLNLENKHHNSDHVTNSHGKNIY